MPEKFVLTPSTPTDPPRKVSKLKFFFTPPKPLSPKRPKSIVFGRPICSSLFCQVDKVVLTIFWFSWRQAVVDNETIFSIFRSIGSRDARHHGRRFFFQKNFPLPFFSRSNDGPIFQTSSSAIAQIFQFFQNQNGNFFIFFDAKRFNFYFIHGVVSSCVGPPTQPSSAYRATPRHHPAKGAIPALEKEQKDHPQLRSF